jgi:hypothetical protein
LTALGSQQKRLQIKFLTKKIRWNQHY